MNYFTLDEDKRGLIVGEESIYLRNKEFNLMQYFVENCGKVLTRTELLEKVWDKNLFCQTNTIDVHVSSLRKKIGQNNAESPIKTIPCVGYMFVH